MKEQDNHINDFDLLINAFLEIGNKMDGEIISSGDEYLYNAEGIGKKIMNHALTIRALFNGYQFQNFQPQVDFSSIAILARSALESYLVLNYLFVAPKDNDEREFKIQSWYLGGLDRIKYKPVSATDQQKWEKEVLLFEQLKTKLAGTMFFKKLKINTQNEILKGNWKIQGWHELAVQAGFNEAYFRKQYMFLCSYSHSNRLSITQVQQIKELNDQREMACAFISILMVVLGKFTYDYVQIMPQLKNKIDLTSVEYRIILLYKTIGEKLNNSSGI